MPEKFVYSVDFTDEREIPAFAGMTRRARMTKRTCGDNFGKERG